jgi:predicted alpha/beta superfamily hydrolase
MTMAESVHWLNYQQVRGGEGVVGNLKIRERVWSPQLENERDLLVYLPPSYTHSHKRYPVIYAQDGQNLFDRATGYLGQEWEVDQTMEKLSEEGLEAIVVGLPHMSEGRISEYNPLPGPHANRGEAYLRFVVDTVKPMIDRAFRTRPDKKHTGLLGSSMGGLISLYGFFYHPHTFGFVGSLSPAYWYAAGGIYPAVTEAPFVSGRIYLDHGTKENSAARMYALLMAKGYKPGQTLSYVKEEGGEHTESAWARRLPHAMRFLLRE